MYGKEFLSGETVWTKMQVVAQDGHFIGEVKEVYDGEFLVDRSMKRDIIIPADCVEKIDRATVYLGVPKHAVDKQGWKKPKLF